MLHASYWSDPFDFAIIPVAQPESGVPFQSTTASVKPTDVRDDDDIGASLNAYHEAVRVALPWSVVMGASNYDGLASESARHMHWQEMVKTQGHAIIGHPFGTLKRISWSPSVPGTPSLGSRLTVPGQNTDASPARSASANSGKRLGSEGAATVSSFGSHSTTFSATASHWNSPKSSPSIFGASDEPYAPLNIDSDPLAATNVEFAVAMVNMKSVSPVPSAWLTHDCMTFSGFSGSPLIVTRVWHVQFGCSVPS